jgi:ABC-type transporter MlaC component
VDATEQEQFDRKSHDRERGGGGSTPNPDPTDLTREALLREIAALKALIDQRDHASEKLFDTKIALGREGGMALKELFSAEVQAVQAMLEAKIEAVGQSIEATEALRNEKFNTVQTQFDLIERQRVENKADTKAAVDAALAAAKEAVKEQTTASDRAITKSETATSEQLKQMNVTFTTAIQGINQPISDLRDRVISLESMRLGGQEQRVDTRASTADARANIGIYIALATVVVSILVVALMALKP